MIRHAALAAALAALAAVASGRVVIEASRDLNTCDPDDRVVDGLTTRVVYAFNPADPEGDDPDRAVYHTRRGSKSLDLLSREPDPTPLEGDTVSLRLADAGFAPTTDKTYYHCFGTRLNISQTHHVTGFDIDIAPGETEYVHHILVYECPGLEDEDIDGTAGQCSRENMPEALDSCNFGSPIASWAVGGRPFRFPPGVGLPVTANMGVLVEVHIDNPARRSLTIDSGIILRATPTLRPVEGGIMTTGHLVDNHPIPPGEAAFDVVGHCPAECTSQFPSPITVHATMLHAHLAGRAITVSHVRDNGTHVVQLPDIASDPYYDFNFQSLNPVAEPGGVVVQPGDGIITTCTYDTRDRTTTTFAGIDTESEMCLSYLVYSPRIAVAESVCASSVSGSTTFAQCGDNFIGYAPPTVDVPLVTPDPCEGLPARPQAAAPQPMGIDEFNASSYDHSETLDGDGDVRFYWTYDSGSARLDMAVDVNTTGWVGFGFSPNGDMIGSDVLLGWWRNGTAHAHDRNAVEHARPPVDAHQDWDNVRVAQSGDEAVPAPGGSGGSGDGGTLDPALVALFDRAAELAPSSPAAPSLYWTVDEDRGTVSFALRATTTGWVALGFRPPGSSAPSMVGSVASLFTAGSGASTATDYDLDGKSAGLVRERTGAEAADTYMTDASVVEAGGFTTARFTRPLKTDFSLLAFGDKGERTTLLWAAGPTDALAQHSSRGTVSVDLATGDLSAVASQPFDNDAVDRHAALMIAAFMVLLPLGAVAARLMRRQSGADTGAEAGKTLGVPPSVWFRAHVALQLVGLLCAVVGFVLAYRFVSDAGSSHVAVTHARLGIAAVALLLAQPIGGALRPAAPGAGERKSGARRAFELVHAAVGYLAVGLGLLAATAGPGAANRGGSLDTTVKVWAAALVAGWAALEAAAAVRRSQRAKGAKRGVELF